MIFGDLELQLNRFSLRIWVRIRFGLVDNRKHHRLVSGVKLSNLDRTLILSLCRLDWWWWIDWCLNWFLLLFNRTPLRFCSSRWFGAHRLDLDLSDNQSSSFPNIPNLSNVWRRFLSGSRFVLKFLQAREQLGLHKLHAQQASSGDRNQWKSTPEEIMQALRFSSNG